MDNEAWRRLSRQELDHQLSPSRSARNVAASFEAWQRRSEEARRDPGIKASLDIAYGAGERQRLDLYTAKDADPAVLRPMHVFIHGGFWQEGSRDLVAFPARAFVAEGWVYAALGYTLAPEATLTGIVAEVRQAIDFLSRCARDYGADPARIVVSGHSAGGHLAASLLAEPANEGASLLGIVPISGVFELAPIRASYVDDAVRMTDEEVEQLSPARHAPLRDIPVALAVGSRETPEFIRQTDILAAAWAPALTHLTQTTIDDRDHFDILLDLCEPSSRLFRLVADMANDKRQTGRTA